ncbi:MAG: beta-ketoacyl synthase chain length factor [Treponema sp.]|jgi:hypothetical protein|nr:beta-ketoacyl synthase chain length factor [Treponema sp.]
MSAPVPTAAEAVLYVSRWTAWAPGLKTTEDWGEWARGNRPIEKSGAGPALKFADPLFRRRLSQISCMTVQVLHDLMPFGEQTKIVFVSFRGELARQLKINRMLVNEGSLTPAAFSFSVFNAPPALATIALGLSAGYSAVYPAYNRFAAGLLAAAAPILCGDAAEIALAYADELIPPEYESLCPACAEPFAFAALLAAKPGDTVLSLRFPSEGVYAETSDGPMDSPAAFLKYLCRS